MRTGYGQQSHGRGGVGVCGEGEEKTERGGRGEGEGESHREKDTGGARGEGGGGGPTHPAVSTFTYLSDHGGPDYVSGERSTLVCHPQRGAHVAFAGHLARGAAPWASLANPRPREGAAAAGKRLFVDLWPGGCPGRSAFVPSDAVGSSCGDSERAEAKVTSLPPLSSGGDAASGHGPLGLRHQEARGWTQSPTAKETRAARPKRRLSAGRGGGTEVEGSWKPKPALRLSPHSCVGFSFSRDVARRLGPGRSIWVRVFGWAHGISLTSAPQGASRGHLYLCLSCCRFPAPRLSSRPC